MHNSVTLVVIAFPLVLGATPHQVPGTSHSKHESNVANPSLEVGWRAKMAKAEGISKGTQDSLRSPLDAYGHPAIGWAGLLRAERVNQSPVKTEWITRKYVRRVYVPRYYGPEVRMLQTLDAKTCVMALSRNPNYVQGHEPKHKGISLGWAPCPTTGDKGGDNSYRFFLEYEPRTQHLVNEQFSGRCLTVAEKPQNNALIKLKECINTGDTGFPDYYRQLWKKHTVKYEKPVWNIDGTVNGTQAWFQWQLQVKEAEEGSWCIKYKPTEAAWEATAVVLAPCQEKADFNQLTPPKDKSLFWQEYSMRVSTVGSQSKSSYYETTSGDVVEKLLVSDKEGQFPVAGLSSPESLALALAPLAGEVAGDDPAPHK